jgi:hypothetical protein
VKALLLALALGTVAGCGASSPRAEAGRIIYKSENEKAHVRSSLLLTTQPQEAEVAVAKPDLKEQSSSAEAHVAPDALGALVARLDDAGFFALPGSHAVPETPAPRSIAVDLASRKFYIAFQDLRDKDEIDRYAKAVRLILAASLAGPHDSIPPPPR